MATFQDLMKGFGVVTVMNACIYKLREGKSYVGRGSCQHGDTNAGAFKPSDFECTGLYLDTLKIANFTQEGPTKTITGGQYANPLIKYGKTMTCEMQDALGRAAVLEEFFGCEYKNGRLSVTDKFPGAFAIEGDTFFIDQKTGDKVYVHILIPQFLPEAILTLTQDAEGDATVFDLNGTVSVTTICNEAGGDKRDIFYEIREEAWFQNTDEADGAYNKNHHEDAAENYVYFYVGADAYEQVKVVEGKVEKPADPQIPGYDFAGWAALEADGGLGTAIVFEENKAEIAAGTKLYALTTAK